MPTRRGWAVALTALALAAAGRVLGVFELFVLAAGAVGLLGAGAASVLRRVDLDANRQLRPARVHAGGNTRVELVVVNRSGRRSPVLSVRDTVVPSMPPRRGRSSSGAGRRQARFLLAPLAPGEENRATYRLPAETRGTYSVGPLEAVVSDSLGLWSRAFVVAPTVELTVYPAVEPVAPLPHSRGDDPTAGAPRPAAVGPSGEDFYGLRPYQLGDDLRRVHWPSTARTGELVVRQLERPWQGRATVLLDARATAHSDVTFEVAVSATASILLASFQSGALVRLATSDGTDSGLAAGHGHFEAILEHLAVLEPSSSDGLPPVVAGLRRAGNGGGLAVITTTAAPATDLELLAGLHARFDSLTIVLVERRGHSGPSAAGARRGGATLLRVPGDRGFAAAWNHSMGGGVAAPVTTGGWR
ncbi:MAG TPA: DUF58 domain-containing protein [Acidimicrobiales bacterium]|nr:DUF58 domain-containing protein [Acidimicrobiales bacterium]